MKKALMLLPLMFLLFGCRQEPTDYLPDIPTGALQAKLTKSNSTLTTDDSTSELTVSLPTEGNTTYDVKLGAPCYAHSKFDEIVVKPGAYIKSASNYKVDRLIVDFFGSKGVSFGVYSNSEGTGEKLKDWKSKVAPVDEAGGGMVYEYKIDSTGWMIKNETENNKPAFYSVTVVFTIQ